MLTPQQLAHFETFGFLHFRGAFNTVEMATISAAAEETWHDAPRDSVNEEIRHNYFVERSPRLMWLVTDERIYAVTIDILGTALLWVGSEGNISSRSTVPWHPDRKYYLTDEEHWMDFAQIKWMLYLDDVGPDSGCLRVIPGSHRMPLHKSLAEQETDPEIRPFGVEGRNIPAISLASRPGDLILFSHTLWHAAFGGSTRRRYLALKFAGMPTADHHFESLRKYSSSTFEPHKNFVNSDDARIRSMVQML